MPFDLEDHEDPGTIEVPPEPTTADVVSEQSLLGVLNRHRSTLLALRESVAQGRLSQAELNERLERMAGDGERVVAAHLAQGVGQAIEPSGTAQEALRAYQSTNVSGVPDGGLVLQGVTMERLRNLTTQDAVGQGARAIRLPNGQTIVSGRAGYLTDSRPMTREQARIQQAYSNFGVALRIALKTFQRKHQRAPSSPYDLVVDNPTVRTAFFALDRAIRSAVEPAGRLLLSMYERVMSGGSGTGGDWIAAPYLQGGWVGPSDLMPQIVERIPRRDAPAAEFTAPSIPGGELIARLRGRVQSNQPAAYPIVEQSTGKRSIAIVSLVMRLLLDDEWLEDFTRNGLVTMEDLLNRLRRGLRRTLEAAVLHGDTTASHQDALASWPMGSLASAGAYDGSDSPLRGWKGLRRSCFDDSGTANDASGTFTGTTAMAMIARLGTRAASPDTVWTCNINLLYKKLMVADDFRLWSSVGEMAAARTGAMGTMLGRDVLLSEFMTSDLNASGVFDNVTTTKTSLLLWDPAAWEMWDLLDETLLDVATAETGAVHLIAKRRCSLESATVTDNGHKVAMDYNL